MKLEAPTPEQRARTYVVISLLVQRFPAAFPVKGAEMKPLAKGVHEALAASLGSEVSNLDLEHALRAWCGAPRYLRALTAREARRVDLEGNPIEDVSELHARVASSRLHSFMRRRDAASVFCRRASLAPAGATERYAFLPLTTADRERPAVQPDSGPWDGQFGVDSRHQPHGRKRTHLLVQFRANGWKTAPFLHDG